MNKLLRLAVLSGALIGLAAIPAQGPGLDRVMRQKLEHAQKILEAVVTSDWASLEANSRDLERLTNDPRWTILRYPEYAQRSAAFTSAIRTLHKAAVQRDLEATPKAYIDVTMQCVECHRYLARARLAEP
jgi:hypothetical protein